MSVLDQTSGVSYATLSDAISGSAANDVLQVPAGSYVENFPNITHNLTINAVGGFATLSNPQPLPPNGRAILNIPGDSNVSLSIFSLEISGASNNPSPANGAGILFEQGNGTLTVSNSWIHDNEDGILTGGADAASLAGMAVVITNSEISNNGGDPATNPRFGFDHNIYAGTLTHLTVSNSNIHDAHGGHEIKTNALWNTITNNHIEDGPTAETSYSIDIVNGGTNVITGNIIQKGAASPQKYVIHFSGSGTPADTSLLVNGNTFTNNRADGAVAVFNDTSNAGANIPATITNNTLYGFGIANLSFDNAGSPVDNASGNTFIAPCFAAGTHILTARGEVAVEALAPGDVVTRLDGRLAAITWIGHRRVDCAHHPRPADVLPVRVRAGAFGPGQPIADLLLSPDHAVFTGNVLIPIRYLVNGRSIAQEAAGEITYYHVELAEHAVLLAEGLPCESFLDTGNRAAFANGGGTALLHADFARAVWAERGCAELVLAGPRLEAAKRRLLAQAATLGDALTDEPDLHVYADGTRLPVGRDGATWRVRLLRAASIRLVSRQWIPQQTRADEQDARRLGVAIGNLRFDGTDLRLDDPRLGDGWLAPEAAWRWTDGDAVLTLLAGEFCFDLVLSGTYWASPAAATGRPTDAPRRTSRAAPGSSRRAG